MCLRLHNASSVLSSTAPCCLLLALTEAAARLAWTSVYCLLQDPLKVSPSALWGHCPVTHFQAFLMLPISLYFSYVIGDPTLRAFLGLSGLWVLDLPSLVYPNPSQFPVRAYKVFVGISWARFSYLGPSLSMETAVSRLTHCVPVNKQPYKTLQSMTL